MSKRTRRARVKKRAAQSMKESKERTRAEGRSLPADGSALLIHGAGQPPALPGKIRFGQ